MELSRIAAKQKRLKEWVDYLPLVQDLTVRAAIEKRAGELRRVLTECWETRSIDAAHAHRIADLERQLEQLNEEARIRVVGRESAR